MRNVRSPLLQSKPRQFLGVAWPNTHGQVGRHYFSHAQPDGVDRSCSQGHQQLVRLCRPRTRAGQLRRRQLRPNLSRLHRRRLDAVSSILTARPRSPGGEPWGVLLFGKTAPGPGARSGSGSTGQRRLPTNTAYLQKTTLPYEDTPLDLDPDGEGPARPAGDPHHRRLQGQRETHRRLRPGEDGAVVTRAAGAIALSSQGPGRAHGPHYLRLRRHAQGLASPEANVVVDKGLLPRGSRTSASSAGSVMGTSGFAQSHADGPGACPGARRSTWRTIGKVERRDASARAGSGLGDPGVAGDDCRHRPAQRPRRPYRTLSSSSACLTGPQARADQGRPARRHPHRQHRHGPGAAAPHRGPGRRQETGLDRAGGRLRGRPGQVRDRNPGGSADGPAGPPACPARDVGRTRQPRLLDRRTARCAPP